MQTIKNVNYELVTAGANKYIHLGIQGQQKNWPVIFGRQVRTREQAMKYLYESPIGMLTEADENEPLATMQPLRSFTKKFTTQEYGGLMTFSQRLKATDIYGRTQTFGKRLGVAAVKTLNAAAAYALMRAGFASGNSAALRSYDGAPVFGTHTTASGKTWSNLYASPVSVSIMWQVLSELMTQLEDDDSPIEYGGKYNLVSSMNILPLVETIVGSDHLMDRADNAKNTSISKRIGTVTGNAWLDVLGYKNAVAFLPTNGEDNPFTYFELQGIQTEAYWDPKMRKHSVQANMDTVMDATGHHNVALILS